MRRVWGLLALIALVGVAGCVEPTRDPEVPASANIDVVDLAPFGDTIPAARLSFSTGDNASFERIRDAVVTYNAALAAIQPPADHSGTFDEHAARFIRLAEGLEQEKQSVYGAFDHAKIDLGVYPTWRELDAARATFGAHHQAVLDTVGRDVQAAFSEEAAVHDAERRALAWQLLVYGSLAIPVVAGVSWLLTHVWERKQRYWGSFTSQKLFLDPRLPMLLVAGAGILAGTIVLLALPASRDLLSFLLPW